MSNLKSLLGEENILAECSGVNYNVYVTQSKLLVGKRFTLDERILNIPHSSINTLELITKSIIPPLTLAIISSIGFTLVWWFPGQQKLALPAFPYDYVIVGVVSALLVATVGAWWRRRVGILRIGVVGAHEPITVRLVSSSKASIVFRALKS